MKLDTALYQLRRTPLPFLENNLLRLAGSSTSGVRMNYFCRCDAAAGANEGFSVETSRAQAAQPVGLHTDTYKALQVHNVRMIPRSEGVVPTSIEPYTLGYGGPDIMVTGQLNACTFAIRKEAHQLIVAHIQPAGRTNTHHDGTGYSGQGQLAQRLANRDAAKLTHRAAQHDYMRTLTYEDRHQQADHGLNRARRELGTETGLAKGWMQQTVKLTGRFEGHGRVTHVFGPIDYNVAAYVVGVRTGGVWHLYAQRVAGSKGPIQSVAQIV